MNSIQRQIQPLNPQMELNVNSNQRQIQPVNPQIRVNMNYHIAGFIGENKIWRNIKNCILAKLNLTI